MSLLRYAETPEDGIVCAPDGDWCLHAEAEAAIAQLEAALAEAQALALQNGLKADARIRELEFANEQRRLVIDALERKLAAKDVLRG